MTSVGTIEHDGIVQRSDYQSVTVKIASTSACSGCHAAANCSILKTEEKTIDVHGRHDVNPGDRVTILMEKRTGYSAVILGYIIPLFLVVSLLVIFTSLRMQEAMAGVVALTILVPYYLVLYAFRKQISRKFIFTIKD